MCFCKIISARILTSCPPRLLPPSPGTLDSRLPARRAPPFHPRRRAVQRWSPLMRCKTALRRSSSALFSLESALFERWPLIRSHGTDGDDASALRQHPRGGADVGDDAVHIDRPHPIHCRIVNVGIINSLALISHGDVVDENIQLSETLHDPLNEPNFFGAGNPRTFRVRLAGQADGEPALSLPKRPRMATPYAPRGWRSPM